MTGLDILLLLLLAALAFLALRALLRNRGGGCTGDCAACRRKKKGR